MNIFMDVMAYFGACCCLIILSYFFLKVFEAIGDFNRKRQRVHDDLNSHGSLLLELTKRIEFLERCEGDRIDAENRKARLNEKA